MSGKREVSSLRASAIVAALQSTFGAPSVKRRNAVGISMVTGISKFSLSSFNLSLDACGSDAKLRVEISLEGFETRRDGFGGRKFCGNGVGGLQAVAGDADNGGFVGFDAILGDEFLRHACGHATGCFRKDAFGFGKQFDGLDNFGVGDVFGPASGVANLLYSKRAVGR